jgi:hypothetical protein
LTRSDTLLTRAVDPAEWDRPDWLTRRERDECAGARRREKVAARAAAKSLLMECLALDADRAVPTDIEWVPGDRGRPVPHYGGQLEELLGDQIPVVSVSWSHTEELVTLMIARISRL